MKKTHAQTAKEIIQYGEKLLVGNITMEQKPFLGNNIAMEDRELVGFIFCDYLGLSVDNRVKTAAKEALDKFGAFTSASRTYIKLGLYDEVEELLSKIFNKPVILTTRTSLGHVAALPVLTDRSDAIILDHYVHTTVRIAADMLRGYGNSVEMVRHNNLNKLEQRIKELREKHQRIWYLADGVYSMHGDTLPAQGLNYLLNKYDSLHIYVDDAHGMSWTGQNGCGYALANMPHHPRLFVITSLAKGFGTGGGVIVCNDEIQRETILKGGTPLIFSGPVTPSTLGAIKASAQIHLSDAVTKKQENLSKLIHFFHSEARRLKIPVIKKENTPIAFVPTGDPYTGMDISNNIKNHGFFVACGVFPAVPYHNSGLRVVLSAHHTKDQIRKFAQALRYELDKVFEQKNTDQETVLKNYKEEIIV